MYYNLSDPGLANIVHSAVDCYILLINFTDVTKFYDLPLMQEAALIIWEGKSNAKFYRHPTTKWSKRSYAILNNPFYHFFHFAVCNVLLLLAVVELPSVEEDFIPMEVYLNYILPVSSYLYWLQKTPY